MFIVSGRLTQISFDLQIDLKGDFYTLRNTIKEMRHLKWTDRFTRAVFVEFTVYNAQVNLFVIVNMVAEFVDSAGIYVHYRVDPVNLLGQVGPVGNFELACQVRFFPWCSHLVQLVTSSDTTQVCLAAERDRKPTK